MRLWSSLMQRKYSEFYGRKRLFNLASAVGSDLVKATMCQNVIPQMQGKKNHSYVNSCDHLSSFI